VLRGVSKVALKELGKNSQAQYPTRTPTLKPIIVPNFGATHDAQMKEFPNFATQVESMKPFLTQVVEDEMNGILDIGEYNVLCYKWNTVTKSLIGQNICVYGEVYSTRYVVDNYQILFSKDPFAFYFEVIGGYFDLKPGECIYFESEVKKSPTGHPYFQIDEIIYMCESWMK
jgi:hypothetical protein